VLEENELCGVLRVVFCSFQVEIGVTSVGCLLGLCSPVLACFGAFFVQNLKGNCMVARTDSVI
jgi:hypothetical protein